MSSREPVVHSFIVRIWLEEGAEVERITIWHGQVTHVQGGESRYFRDFGALVDFIISSLGFVGRRRRGWLGRRLRRWLRLPWL
jgi:hypothetical protein